MEKNYQKCYELYCQSKEEIDEEPLAFESWYELEIDAEKNW